MVKKEEQPNRKLHRSIVHNKRTYRSIVLAVAALLLVLLVVGLVLVWRDGVVPGDSSVVAQRETEQEESKEQKDEGQDSKEQTSQTITSLTLEQVEVPSLSIYRRRNPFKPLVNMEELPEEIVVAGGVVTVPSSLAPGLSDDSRVVSRAVTLHSVEEEGSRFVAKISVGDSVFNKLKTGDVFAKNFKVLAIGKEGSVTLLYGDERFTVRLGQTVYW